MTSGSDEWSKSLHNSASGSSRPLKNNFHTRLSEKARALNGQLVSKAMQSQVISQMHKEQEISYGFEQLQVFRNFIAVTRAIRFSRSGEFTADLVDDVLKPVMYEELLDRFPLSDASFSVAMFTFSLKHIWTDPRGLLDNVEARHELVELRYFYGNDDAVNAFVYYATYIRESIRKIVAKCYWLLTYMTRSRNHLTWSIPEKFFEMRPQLVGAALASTPINGDFSMFLRQLWLARQIGHGHRILNRNRQAGISGPIADREFPRQSEFVPDTFDPSIVDTNYNEVISMFDKYYGLFSYFEDALVTLTAYIDIDFELPSSNDDFFTRQDLTGWMKSRLSVSRIRFDARIFTVIKVLLMEHFLFRLGERYQTSVKTHARIDVKLKTKSADSPTSRKRTADQISESSSSAKRTSASL